MKTTLPFPLLIAAAAASWSFFCFSTGSFRISSRCLTHLSLSASSNIAVPNTSTEEPRTAALAFSTTVLLPTPGTPTITILRPTVIVLLFLGLSQYARESRRELFELLLDEHLVVLEHDVDTQEQADACPEDPEDVGD